MVSPRHSARALVVVAAAAIAFVVGCADRAISQDPENMCMSDGEWDHDTWCQYPALQVEQRHGLSGYAVAARLPVPEGGCGACDGELVEQHLQQRIDEKCPGGIIEFETGCSSLVTVSDGSGDLECGYLGFVWGESCSNLN